MFFTLLLTISIIIKFNFSFLFENSKIERLKKELNELNSSKILKDEELKNKINELNKFKLLSKPFEVKESYVNDTEFYDIIIDIKSIISISNGWDIYFNSKGKNNYMKLKNESFVKVGVIGNRNMGKSFLLSKITKYDLPIGSSISTRGLSLKFPDLENQNKNNAKNFVIIDSAGMSTPVLYLDKINENDKNKDDKLIEKERDKSHTESFLEGFIIEQSDIIIVVVGVLTDSDQKLIEKVSRKICQEKLKKNIIVVNNLREFIKIKQVEEYIENILQYTIPNKLQKKIRSYSENNNNIKKCDYYFHYKYEGVNNWNLDIIHLIYAREDSEAGKYYNNFALEQIGIEINHIHNQYSFPVIEKIIDYFMINSQNIFKKKLKKDNFKILYDEENNKYLLKYNKTENFKLTRIYKDELGSSIILGNYQPKYNYFKKNKKLIILLEIPGTIIEINYGWKNNGNDFSYIFKGKRKIVNIIKPEAYKNTIEEGDFKIEFSIPTKESYPVDKIYPCSINNGDKKIILNEENIIENIYYFFFKRKEKNNYLYGNNGIIQFCVNLLEDQDL